VNKDEYIGLVYIYKKLIVISLIPKHSLMYAKKPRKWKELNKNR